MHYYRLNVSDWGLATSHLSLEEEAIYFRLINYYYDTERKIPLNIGAVARRLRLTGSEEMMADIMGEFFIKNDDGWLHERCEKDLKEFRKLTKKNKINGAKGGRPAKTVALKETQTKPTGLPNETQTKGNQYLVTSNQYPVTNNHKKDKQKDSASKLASESEFESLWDSYGKKGNRKSCLAKYTKLSKVKQKALISAVPDYVLSTPEKQYRKNLETYINQECWNDEIQQNEVITHEKSTINKISNLDKSNDWKYSAPEQVERAYARRDSERNAPGEGVWQVVESDE